MSRLSHNRKMLRGKKLLSRSFAWILITRLGNNILKQHQFGWKQETRKGDVWVLDALCQGLAVKVVPSATPYALLQPNI